ncbi:hypothetical protein SELMODRAFT_413062 [Selaginella moellendorffii]|uniref:3-hydroxyisobutyryl-CoA hydrolase n=1 Tax=Selaginella moellendorffii TaxID=88036 RepID=D8RN80_SELML|nr:hypothetical protein SELMODRAFT_413062 [Selaginella moellendorffii]
MNRLSSENNVVPIGMLRLLRGGMRRLDPSHRPVNGESCDGQPGFPPESFDAMDELKKTMEESCPRVVSCADILEMGTRDADVPELEKTLLNLQPESSIQEAIQGFAKMPEAEASSVMKRQNFPRWNFTMTWINNCFSKDRVEEIIESLASTNDEWCKETARSLRRLLPIALKQALASIRQGRTQSLKKCLEREQRITLNCLRSLVSDDLYEGIRAVVVDKDRAPKWNPSTLAEVTDDMVEMILNTYTAREQIQLPLEDEERLGEETLEDARNQNHFDGRSACISAVISEWWRMSLAAIRLQSLDGW